MDESNYLIFAKKLLMLQSHTPAKSGVPQFLVDTLNAYGINATVVQKNGIKNIVAKTEGEPSVLFNGHWDTVLPDATYEKDRQDITEKDGILYGLGSCDMKSGVAAMVAAFIECSQTKVPGVLLCLVGDEETGGKNGTGHLVSEGYIAPYVILGEPSDLKISLGQKSGMGVTVHSSGISAHGAYPHRGSNAIQTMNQFLNLIFEHFPVPSAETSNDEIFQTITASVNTITAGTSPNVIPSTCVATIDVRMPPKVDPIAVQNKFKQLAAKVAGVTVDIEFFGYGWELDTTNTFYKTVKQVMEKEFGKPVPFVRKMGTNDGKYYASKGSLLINVGPGDNKLSHTVKEKVSIKELEQYRNIYKNIATSLST